MFSFLPFLGSEERTIQSTDTEKGLKRYLFTNARHEGQLDYERLCTIITGAQWRLNARKALDTLRTRHHRFVQAPELGSSAQIKI